MKNIIAVLKHDNKKVIHFKKFGAVLTCEFRILSVIFDLRIKIKVEH